MAAKDYDDLSREILEHVGGVSNIRSVAHCITRLRFKLKDVKKADTEVIERLPGVIKVMSANGQYHVVVGNKVEDVYDSFLAVSGLSGGGGVGADGNDDEEGKSPAAVLIDLISGIFQPMLGTLSAAGIMRGILACVVQAWPAFENDGAYTLLYTVADGFFYFLPVILAYNAAKKFKMSEFNAIAIAFALVYPTMVGLTSGEVIGSFDLGLLGTFSWYATFFGIPIIMPAAGYTSSVIPILLMIACAAPLERWVKSWMPASLRMFFTPLIVVTVTVVLGYLLIGPVATLITNVLSSIFQLIFGLPVVGSVLGCTVVAAFWMVLVIFGFHWSLVPLAIVNISNPTLGYDFILASIIGHSFALGAVVFAMYLKNKDEKFRAIALPAMISSFFFGVTEPAIYGVALPDKRAFVVASIGSALGGLLIGLSGAVIYVVGGLGVFNWLSYVGGTTGFTYMWWAIAASLAAAVLAFAIEFTIYKPEAPRA